MKSRMQGEFLQTDLIEWEDFPEEFQTGGVQWKLLHVSPEIGSWTVLLRCPAGSTFAPHVHHGPAEGYVFEGVIQETTGGGTFTAPAYLYEAAGAVHDRTLMTEDTVFMLQMIGPVGWKRDDGSQNPQGWMEAQQHWEKQRAARSAS